jgi:FkbM family methyltransferase
VLDHPLVDHAIAELVGGFEDSTLQFFDAALPHCRRLIDVGGYFGLLSLYAGDRVDHITIFEPSPTHQSVLQENLALNPGLAARSTLIPAAIGALASEQPLYRKAFADSGASLFEVVERQNLRRGEAEAMVRVLPAASALAEAGLDGATLLKIDIEGAEYEVIPAIAALLAQHRPFLQVSFHPFNLVVPDDVIATTLLRLRRMIDVVAALRCYPFWYLLGPAGWREIAMDDFGEFLRDDLLKAKPVARIASPQYGLIDGVGFSSTRLNLANSPSS